MSLQNQKAMRFAGIFILWGLFSGSVLAQQPQTVQIQLNDWGSSFFLEDDGREILTAKEVEKMLDFNYNAIVGFQNKEVELELNDEPFDELIRHEWITPTARISRENLDREPPKDISEEATKMTIMFREYRHYLAEPDWKVKFIRKSDQIRILKQKGVLDFHGHFTKDPGVIPVNSEMSWMESRVIEKLNRHRKRVPKTYAEMTHTRGYVVRQVAFKLLQAALPEIETVESRPFIPDYRVPGNFAETIRRTLADYGQIWEILSEQPKVADLVRDAGLPSGDGETVLTAVLDTLLSQKIISNQLKLMAGTRGTFLTLDDAVHSTLGESFIERRLKVLHMVPDLALNQMGEQIRDKIRTMDLSGQDAIKGIVQLQTGQPNELTALLQGTLSDYFSKLKFEDKGRLALAYLALSPDAPVETQIAAALQATGPLLQKLFQLIGDEVDNETLKKASAGLKATVQPFSGAVARSIIEKELGQPIEQLFSEFADAPIKAGTIGQIHTAKLKATGQSVVVKVMRPGILDHFKRELEILRSSIQDPFHRQLIDNYAKTIMAEMDFRIEGKNIDNAEFMNRPSSNVRIAGRIKSIPVTKNVLVLVRAEGKPVNDMALFQQYPSHDELTALTPAQVNSMIKSFASVTRIWFGNAIFGNGYYHGDIHTGNLMMASTSHSPTAATTVLDFGNFQQLSVEQRQDFIRLFIASFKADLEGVVSIMVRLGQLNIDQALVYRSQLKAANWKDHELGSRFVETIGFATKAGARIPPEFVNFARSRQMLETAMKIVNQNLNFLDPQRVKYPRLDSSAIFGRSAMGELAKSVVQMMSLNYGDGRVLSKAFLESVIRDIFSLDFYRSCAEILAPRAFAK